MTKAFLKGTILQFVVLVGLWLVLSGHYDVFHVGMGVFSAGLVTFMHWRINRYLYFNKGIAAGRSLKIIRLALYVPWLIKQIVLSSLQVAYAVLHPRMPIDPSLLRFRVRLPNMTARVILGNSITLTPGTFTLRIKDDEFLVHSLMKASHTGIVDGSLPGQVARLYGAEREGIVSEIKIFRKARNV